ncbi:MAG: hypothetical protein KF745_05555 [Phycisphaeraceae bacterium]|nr:hypothetical protein [Phycisphaeraceae bacterium]
MLRALNLEILRYQGADSRHIEIILDAFENRQPLIKLFGLLAGRSLQSACREHGHEAFFQAWSRLNVARNMFSHGVPAGEGMKHEPTRDDVELVRGSLLRAFQCLHNGYAAAPLPPS